MFPSVVILPHIVALLNLICQQHSAYGFVSLLYAGYIRAVNALAGQI